MADPALAAELGPGVRASSKTAGCSTHSPLSLLTVRSLGSLGGLAPPYAGTRLAAGRFRPNLLVDAPGATSPRTRVGRVLRVGGLGMRVDRATSGA